MNWRHSAEGNHLSYLPAGHCLRPNRIDYAFLVTRARKTKQPAFTLFVLEIPHIYFFVWNDSLFSWYRCNIGCSKGCSNKYRSLFVLQFSFIWITWFEYSYGNQLVLAMVLWFLKHLSIGWQLQTPIQNESRVKKD